MGWFSLLLFSTPLLRLASLPSADLTYAAGFVALLAAILAAWSRRTLAGSDLMLAALACGILVGAKVSGLPAAVLLVSVLAASWLLRRRLDRDAAARRSVESLRVAAAIALLMLSGGFWPLRNWVNYGSPIAPMGVRLFGMTLAAGGTWNEWQLYLSVLKDLQDPGYNLPARTATFIRQRLGPFYLPTLLLSFLIPLESAFGLARWRAVTPRDGTRQVLWLSVAVTGVLLVWLLVRAPWTSLEWTHGLSLRYELPLIVLVPFLAFVGILTPLARWYERPRVGALVLGLFAVTSLAVFLVHQHTPGLPDGENVPGLDVRALAWSAGLVTCAAIGSRLTNRRRSKVLAVVAGLGASVAATQQLAGSDAMMRRIDGAALHALEACGNTSRIDRFRAVFLEVRRFEARLDRSCSKRRFFVVSRFDQPLALQPVPYSSLVYDVRGTRLVERAVVREAPGERPEWCDYVVVRADERKSCPAADLLVRLVSRGLVEPFGEAGPYLVSWLDPAASRIR